MASINKYKKYAKADIKNKNGGMKNKLLFAPNDTFDSIAMPSATTNLGDKYKITSDHTFKTDEGWIEMHGQVDSCKVTSKTKGKAGSKRTEHQIVIIIEGNDPILYDQLEMLKNEEAIFMVGDAECLTSTAYEQFGDGCHIAEIDVEYDSGQTNEGVKQHTITAKITDGKYWYSGTVTAKP